MTEHPDEADPSVTGPPADAVFGGQVGTEDAPADLRHVVALVRAARGPATAEELAGEDDLVARMAAVVRAPDEPVSEASPVDDPGRSNLLNPFKLEKFIPVTVAMVLVGSAAAAAATGTFTPAAPRTAAPVEAFGMPHMLSVRGGGVRLEAARVARTHRRHAPHTAPAIQLVAAHAPPVVNRKNERAFGVVSSVGGVSTAGTCGAATSAGSFTIALSAMQPWSDGAKTSGAPVTVDVTMTTKFFEPGVSSASFADVCVGVRVGAAGPRDATATGTIDATTVLVVPTPPSRTAGTVTSVAGSTTAGTCGTSGAAGSFTVQPPGHGWWGWSWGRGPVDTSSPAPVTVNVSPGTTFIDPGDPTPSFADVCVGDTAGALGTSPTTGTLDAATVFVSSGGREQGTGHRRGGCPGGSGGGGGGGSSSGGPRLDSGHPGSPAGGAGHRGGSGQRGGPGHWGGGRSDGSGGGGWR